ncbi:MAG: fumarylacetoacetate hydrolase family protein [Chloroflexi bacterium]|nr:fumarylacetoacetate hydrolase family protein [Chloroflexota bacterium]
MPLPHDQLHALAHALSEAEHSATPILPLTEQAPEITSEDAYAIAEDIVVHELEHGHRIVGRKVGLTNPAMQAAFGIDTPILGTVFDDTTVRDGGRIKTSDLIQPKAEPELAFRLKSPLRGPGITMQDVLAATDYVFPALEIVDCRMEGWRIREQDIIADNGVAARVVIGSARLSPGAFNVSMEEVVLYRNGEEFERARASAVMGNPARSVAWCANKLAELGQGLRPGEFVTTGTITTAMDVRPGDTVHAEFATLGLVSVRFT